MLPVRAPINHPTRIPTHHKDKPTTRFVAEQIDRSKCESHRYPIDAEVFQSDCFFHRSTFPLKLQLNSSSKLEVKGDFLGFIRLSLVGLYSDVIDALDPYAATLHKVYARTSNLNPYAFILLVGVSA